jgi:polar amino acid transport system substrate-binding protein
MNDLVKPEWLGYKAPLPPALVTPWAIAISARERGSEFEKILGDIVADWHRSGFLIQREKAWHITPTKFLADTSKIWQRKDSEGKPFCQRGADGVWNAECRNKIFLTSSDVSSLAQIGLWLNEHTGINLTLIYDEVDRSQYLRGLATTLLLTAMCIIGSLVLGIAGAICAELRIPLLPPLARAGARSPE